MKKNDEFYTMLTRESQLDAPFGALEGWQKTSLLRQIEAQLGDKDLAKKDLRSFDRRPEADPPGRKGRGRPRPEFSDLRSA